MMYYPHNVHFIWFSACMEGRSAEALAAARKVAAYVTPEMVRMMTTIEFVPPLPALTLARFGRWEELLREPAPPAELRYASGLWHYARGLALVATGPPAEAHAALDSVEAILAVIPADLGVSTNQARPLLRIARSALAGEIARAEGRTEEGLRALRQAVAAEDSLHYDEPPTWCYPVRQMLGAALLAAKLGKEAEIVYREDLRRHPENGWSLLGLAQSLRAQGNDQEAGRVDARFRKAWARADVTLSASAY
jgi:tetratricopeptide (TPR) repeat protein